ncbi:MAG: autotransporter domain-containing protein [Gammaproteobacteria bacterium]|nr:autotransporter domain-containing protein [Gammaproteobacteria bacterium]MDH5732091.1 autotransporter domain-containing protein [Gammaproteobacteria bacterium]
MMKTKMILLLSCLSLISATNTQAEQIYVESDFIIPIVAKGAHLHLKKSNMFNKRVTLGISLLGLRLRDWMVDEVTNSKNKDWQVEAMGSEFTADYFLKDSDNGFFIGGVLAIARYKLARLGATATAHEMQTGIRGGYLWRPFDGQFYIMPWLAAGYRSLNGDNLTLKGETFPSHSGFGLAGSLNFGWSF